MSTQKYAHFWKKYRPAILRLMVDSIEEPQEYRFTKHEFDDANPKKTGGYSFTLKVHSGRALAKTGNEAAATDLFMMLQRSEKGVELTRDYIFQFALSTDFVLKVSNEELPKQDESSDDELSADEEPQADGK